MALLLSSVMPMRPGSAINKGLGKNVSEPITVFLVHVNPLKNKKSNAPLPSASTVFVVSTTAVGMPHQVFLILASPDNF